MKKEIYLGGLSFLLTACGGTLPYLFPILQEELKRCPSLVQNPGW